MPVCSHKHKLAFYDIPKVASSSVKLELHRLEHGDELEHRSDIDFRKADIDDAIHWVYPTENVSGPQDFDRYQDYWKFAVVRDPVKRMLSAYSNRVVFKNDVHHGRLHRTRAILLGLSLEPDLDTFFLRLSRYRLQTGVVRHHTERVDRFIGTDLSRFEAVYAIEDLDFLAADLEARTGENVRFRRLQTGGPKITVDQLSKPAFDVLMRYLEPEYRLLSDFYDPPIYLNCANFSGRPKDTRLCYR